MSNFRSLLDELTSDISKRDKYMLIEARAHHFITSGIDLLEQIEKNFTTEEANELARRLFNSLKGRDPAKFQRKIKQLKEAKK